MQSPTTSHPLTMNREWFSYIFFRLNESVRLTCIKTNSWSRIFLMKKKDCSSESSIYVLAQFIFLVRIHFNIFFPFFRNRLHIIAINSVAVSCICWKFCDEMSWNGKEKKKLKWHIIIVKLNLLSSSSLSLLRQKQFNTSIFHLMHYYAGFKQTTCFTVILSFVFEIYWLKFSINSKLFNRQKKIA